MVSVAEAVVERDAFPLENASRVVWTLAWPAVALNSLQVVNNFLDRTFVGSLPAATLAGYGAAINVTFLMFSLGMAVSAGATAIVSRGFGAQDVPMYKRGAQESLSVAIFSGLVCAILTAVFGRFMASLVLPPNNVAAQVEMARFLTAFACGLPGLFVVQTLAGTLRGVGDTKSPMYISGIQILLHITLNFLLIFPARHVGALLIPGAGLGLVGAGCALSGAATLSALGYILYLPRTGIGALSPWHVPEAHWMLRILRIAAPAAFMAFVRVGSLFAFSMVLTNVGGASAAIAAMGFGFAIESIMFMPSFGLSMAAAALVGQSLGMKRPDRAEKLGWTAAHYGALVTLCLAAPIYFAAPSISLFMTHGKTEIAMQAAMLLRYLCATEVFFAYAMVLFGAMQGAGDTKRPMYITAVALWGLRVPMAVIFALPAGFRLFGVLPLPMALGFGAAGAWFSLSFTQAVQGLLAVWAFRVGHWKTEKV